jgi:hypothetical protein
MTAAARSSVVTGRLRKMQRVPRALPTQDALRVVQLPVELIRTSNSPGVIRDVIDL